MTADFESPAEGNAEDVSTIIHAESKIGVVEIRRPPNNYLDVFLVDRLGAALRNLDENDACNVVLLQAHGKHFCAGRNFSKPRLPGDESSVLYDHAGALFETRKPLIAVVQGAAIGAGMGLAAVADFRIASTRAYFWPNFVTVGLHHGFGLSVTLPRIVGQHRATAMLLTGVRVGASDAHSYGLVDEVVPEDGLPGRAMEFAGLIGGLSAGAVQSIRQTMRRELAAEFRRAAAHESREQARLTAGKSTSGSEAS